MMHLLPSQLPPSLMQSELQRVLGVSSGGRDIQVMLALQVYSVLCSLDEGGDCVICHQIVDIVEVEGYRCGGVDVHTFLDVVESVCGETALRRVLVRMAIISHWPVASFVAGGDVHVPRDVIDLVEEGLVGKQLGIHQIPILYIFVVSSQG